LTVTVTLWTVDEAAQLAVAALLTVTDTEKPFAGRVAEAGGEQLTL
jgi:hypothetical protein